MNKKVLAKTTLEKMGNEDTILLFIGNHSQRSY